MTSATDAFLIESLCQRYLRPVARWTGDEATGYIPVFDPPLTSEEQATYDALIGLAQSTIELSPTDWAKIAARLPNVRAFRQMTRSEVMALSQAERDRLYFDTLQDVAALLVIMLRDPSG